MQDSIVILITAPSEEVAGTIAKTLVGAQLAACANIIRNIRSIYRWQGNIEDDTEVLMIVKTRRELFSLLEQKVRELHPYTTPEIIALPITDGSKAYLSWLHAETEGNEEQ